LAESEDEEVEQEVFECVACNKVFKSEKQWEAHEKSKKHQKAVQSLQRKMRKENAHLDLHEGDISSGIATPDVDEEVEEAEVMDDIALEVEDHTAAADSNAQLNGDDGTGSEDDEPMDNAGKDRTSELDEKSESEDSDYASPETIQSRLQQTNLGTPSTTKSEPGNIIPEDEDGAKIESLEEPENRPAAKTPKMGKAARKRAKKAAAAAASEQPDNAYTCATCNSAFPSRTQLFQHIKDHGHAALKPASGGGKTKKKAKG
jgi:DnaJ homolog subfamily A member 5